MNLKSDRHSNEHDLSSNKNKAWKNSGLWGIWTHELHNTGVVHEMFVIWS